MYIKFPNIKGQKTFYNLNGYLTTGGLAFNKKFLKDWPGLCLKATTLSEATIEEMESKLQTLIDEAKTTAIMLPNICLTYDIGHYNIFSCSGKLFLIDEKVIDALQDKLIGVTYRNNPDINESPLVAIVNGEVIGVFMPLRVSSDKIKNRLENVNGFLNQ